MPNTYVVGDLHGCHKGLVQVLEKVNFNYEEDTLIQLGDIADGWSEVYQCVEELMKIKNLIKIKGNHDAWFLEWLLSGKHPVLWRQGGEGTLSSYCKALDKSYVEVLGDFKTNLLCSDIPESHREFFKTQVSYYVDEHNRLFVHGGFNRHYHIDDEYANDESVLIWDRDFWMQAMSCGTIVSLPDGSRPKLKTKDNFKEVFIGHTTTEMWKYTENNLPEELDRAYLGLRITTPMNAGQVWNLDTGGGWSGKVTIMDVNTKEYWQSDLVQSLYPDEKGRR